jgi:anti-sigma factor RsiW
MDECDLQLLSAYIDGELSPAQRQSVDAHLRQCPKCAAEVDALTNAMEMIRTYQPFVPGREDLDRLFEKVDQSIDLRAERSLWRLGLVVSAMAASILIVSVAWLAELPPVPEGSKEQVATTPPEAWERLAATLRPDPIDMPPSGATPPTVYLAQAEPFASWMLRALKER